MEAAYRLRGGDDRGDNDDDDSDDDDDDILALFAVIRNIVIAGVAALMVMELERPLRVQRRLTIDMIPDDDAALRNFRFTRSELRRLLVLLQIPAQIATVQRYHTTGEEAFLILLVRLAYPGRLCELGERVFGRSMSALSAILSSITIFMRNMWGSHVNVYWPTFEHGRLLALAEATAARYDNPSLRAPMFVDGVFYAVNRPGVLQSSIYNGHHKAHGVTFMAAASSDGLLPLFIGPFPGTMNDRTIFDHHGPREVIRTAFTALNQQIPNPVFTIGDGIFEQTEYMRTTHPRQLARAPPSRLQLTRARIMVEQMFGELKGMFAFVTYRRQLSLRRSPIPTLIRIAVLLFNCKRCFNRTHTERFYGIRPPTIENYLTHSEYSDIFNAYIENSMPH